MSIVWSRMRSGLLVAVAVALCAALAGPAAAQSVEERRLEQTKAKLDAVSAELSSAKSQQSSDAASFAKAEKQLAVVMEALHAAEQAVDRQQQAVTQAAEKLDELESAQRREHAALSGRAVQLYKQGSFLPMGSVLAAESPKEALRRTALVDVVSRSNRRAFEHVTVTATAITAQRKQLKIEQDSLERVAEQQREIAAEAEELRNDRALALAASSHRVRALQGQESHLEEESKELAALARRAQRAAEAASRSAAAPAASGGSVPVGASGWVWPASGPVTSEFGYRWGRMHEGIDIGGPSGAPIYAATGGTVSYAGSMSGYGNLVLVDHGGGIVTAYAHQSQILVSQGTNVAGGQQIGKVGSTGNSTGPHLHFEVRVGGSPRNPRSYLP